MAEFKDFYFESSSYKHRIHARCCLPEGKVKGVVQIAHGIAEHINRYDEFAAFLAANGFAVYGNDHLGHGQSIGKAEEKGRFTENNGWNTVVNDMVKLHDIASAQFPGVPYIMFGHSMGSFLTRTYIIDHSDKFDLAVLSGTGHQSKLLVIGGNLMADTLVKLKGYKADGKALNDLAFGSYLNKIENPKTAFDWLSVSEENIKKYLEDELCGFVCSMGLYADMMHGIKYITNMKNIKKMDVTKPIYFMSGKDDPVGDYGAGVEKAYKCFCDAGVRDVTIRLYDGGRHEMLNETNREDVYKDILNWINSKI